MQACSQAVLGLAMNAYALPFLGSFPVSCSGNETRSLVSCDDNESGDDCGLQILLVSPVAVLCHLDLDQYCSFSRKLVLVAVTIPQLHVCLARYHRQTSR